VNAGIGEKTQAVIGAAIGQCEGAIFEAENMCEGVKV
jgi:hypothetical protein